MARSLSPLPVLLLAFAAAAGAEPPPLPADESPASLLAALPAAEREAVLDERRVVTFAEERLDNGRGAIYRALSVGVLPHPPGTVRGLLRQVGGYPDWVRLSPTYKEVRVPGAARIETGVGKSSSPRTRETLAYTVAHSDRGTTWTLSSDERALEAGSQLAWEVVPLPGSEGRRSLVVHRQEGRLSGRGRLSKYLDSEDKHGRNRFWKDANKHARRLHWAMDAALTHPPGRDREARYLDRYAVEFDGGTPYWAR